MVIGYISLYWKLLSMAEIEYSYVKRKFEEIPLFMRTSNNMV